MEKWKNKIEQNKRLKSFLHNLLMHPIRTRPRFWVRLFQFIYLKKGKNAVIYRSVRKDLVPFRGFFLGNYSIIEDYSILNNAVGDIVIGDYSRIGFGNTIIGPIKIGSHVNLGQNVVLSGLNHNYSDVNVNIAEQGVSTLQITIEDNAWIGANSTVLAGVSIGTHSIVGAGSVVVHNIPPYSVCVGNPARVIKQYDFEKKEWMKI